MNTRILTLNKEDAQRLRKLLINQLRLVEEKSELLHRELLNNYLGQVNGFERNELQKTYDEDIRFLRETLSYLEPMYPKRIGE